MVNTLLCDIDHSKYNRFGDPLMGNWDSILNFINIEAQQGVTVGHLFSVLFGALEEDIWCANFRLAAAFHIHVLRPLCWLGFLFDHRVGGASVEMKF